MQNGEPTDPRWQGPRLRFTFTLDPVARTTTWSWRTDKHLRHLPHGIRKKIITALDAALQHLHTHFSPPDD